MFLQPPAVNEAVARLFEDNRKQMGFVMNLSRCWAWRPDICTDFSALRTRLSSGSSLTPRELAVLVSATAASLGDAYCALAWGSRLAKASDPATAASVLKGESVDGEALSARESALARWARQVVGDPNGSRAEQVQELRHIGLDDKEIFEATAFIAFRIAFSTVNDALGVSPDRQLAEQAPPEVLDAVDFGRAVDDGKLQAVSA